VSDRLVLSKASTRSCKQSGFTLVELMVALLLGLVLLGSVVTIMSSTRQTLRGGENLARMQESARFAFEILLRDLRDAGANPCGARSLANVIRVSGVVPWWADWDSGAVRGFDGSEATTIAPFGTSAAARVDGTDAVLTLRTALDEAAVKLVSAHDPAGPTFTLPAAAPIKSNDIVLACDAKSGALLQVGTIGGSTDIEYGTGTLNCTDDLGYPTPANCTGTTARTFDPGASITKWEPGLWYVGINSRGSRSLFRKTPVPQNSGAVTVQSEEIIPGVHDMQVDYLTRDAAGSTLSTAWVPASDTTFAAASGAWTATNTKQVVAVRVRLTIRSEENVGTDGTPLERQFVAVAALRARDL